MEKQCVKDFRTWCNEYELEYQPYEKKEIDDAKKKFGSLPKLLIEYYKKLGAFEEQGSFYAYIFSPDELHVVTKEDLQSEGWKDAQDYLIIASESSGTYDIAIALSDLEEENPPLYCAGEMFEELSEETQYHSGKLAEEVEFYKLDHLSDLFPMMKEIIAESLELGTGEEEEEEGGMSPFEMMEACLRGEYDSSTLEDYYFIPIDNNFAVNFSGENIKDLSFFSRLPYKNIKILQLRDNEITDLSPLKDFVDLQVLDVCGNQITSLEPLKKLTNLKLLYVGENQIKDISVVENMKQLQVFGAWNNQIEDMSVLLDKDLEVCMIQGNKIPLEIEEQLEKPEPIVDFTREGNDVELLIGG